MKEKIFFSRLNFSKAELRNASVQLGNVGVPLPIRQSQEFEVKDDWLQLGNIWSGMNDPKYYKDLKVTDIIPKPEDFVDVPYRLISATTVGAGSWKAADFSDENVLKASVNKLVNKPIYKDHETDTDNWVGLVKSTKWSPSVVQNGITIPAGIDGLLAIDAKTNPKVARGALLGAIQSNSVTVDFKWKMSHTFENEWDFYDKVGTIGYDGKMIRRIVVEVIDYYETSLLWLGADPFAKKINENGELQNIDTGSVYEFMKSSFGKGDVCTFGEECEKTKEILKKEKKYSISFALDKNLLSLAREVENNQEDMKQLVAFFVAQFGEQLGLQKDVELTQEQLIEHLGKMQVINKDDSAKVENYDSFVKGKFEEYQKENPDAEFSKFVEEFEIVNKADFKALQDKETEFAKEKKDLEDVIAGNKTFVELGKSYIDEKRNEAIRLYKLSAGEKVDDSVIDLFKSADNKQIDGLLKQYTNDATGKFKAVCKSCGSHDFSFQSTYVAGEGDGEQAEEVEAVSVDDMRNELLKENTIPIH